MAAADSTGTGSLWNQGSWHWEERNYTAWAHSWLRERLRALPPVAAGDWTAALAGTPEVKGDVCCRALHPR